MKEKFQAAGDACRLGLKSVGSHDPAPHCFEHLCRFRLRELPQFWFQRQHG